MSIPRIFLMTIVSLLSVPTVMADVYFQDNGITFRKQDYASTTVSVTKPQVGSYSGAIVVPTQASYLGTVYPVTSIDSYAFMNSTITSLTIPAGVTLNPAICYGCSRLSDLNLYDGITIPPVAFYGCTAIKDLVLPAGVKFNGGGAAIGTQYISFQAFGNCNLKSVTVRDVTPPNAPETTFEGSYSANLIVPAQSVQLYRTATEWKKFQYLTSSIESVKQDLEFEITEGRLVMSGEADLTVSDINGIMLFHGVASEYTFDVPGIYIVKINGGKVMKIKV